MNQKKKETVSINKIFEEIYNINNDNYKNDTTEADRRRFYRLFRKLCRDYLSEIPIYMREFLIAYIKPMYLNDEYIDIIKNIDKGLRITEQEYKIFSTHIDNCLKLLPVDSSTNEFIARICRRLEINKCRIYDLVEIDSMSTLDSNSYQKLLNFTNECVNALDELKKGLEKKLIV